MFRLYQNSNITPDMMNLVRTKYPHYQKNAIHFFRRKIKSCYELRLGAELAAKFHMKLKKEELEEIKQEKIRRENEEDNDREREREAEMEERIRREVEERVQLAVEERMRTERKRDRNEVEDEEDNAERRNKHARAREREVVRARQNLPVLEQMGDPNSTVLEEEPAAIAVVPTAPTSDSAGPSSRPGRAMLRCPVDGCFVTRRNEALMNLHVENSHQ